MKTKILTIALAILTIGLLGSCKKENPTVSVTDVILDKTSLTLTEGDNAQLTATIAPENASNKNVSWSSSDEAVAMVSSEGNVTAVKAGTATITVTTEDGSKTATCNITVLENIDGALTGVFSVSDTKKVRFSKGNLQAIFVGHAGISYSFRFAENQYDCIGNAPGNTTIDESRDRGVVDLFGWSTDSNTSYGINTSQDDSDYSGNFRDWGNKIYDDNTWRTLSKDEWTYLFSNHSCKWATVNGVNGYVIAPDGFSGELASSYANDDALASAGNLVFLPAAGYRYGSDVSYVGDSGYYWSSSALDEYFAYSVNFDGGGVSPGNGGRHFIGVSVRLITEVI